LKLSECLCLARVQVCGKGSLPVADRELSRDEALAILRGYAMRYAGTVLLYDLAGDEDGGPGPGGASEPVDEVTLADIGAWW
jgi:hypothetical protein